MRRTVQRIIAILFCGAATYMGGILSGPAPADARAESCDTGPCGLVVKERCAIESAKEARCACVGTVAKHPECRGKCEEGAKLTCTCQNNTLCNPDYPGTMCLCTCRCLSA